MRRSGDLQVSLREYLTIRQLVDSSSNRETSKQGCCGTFNYLVFFQPIVAGAAQTAYATGRRKSPIEMRAEAPRFGGSTPPCPLAPPAVRRSVESALREG